MCNMPHSMWQVLGVQLMLVLFAVRLCQCQGSRVVVTVTILALSNFIE